MTIDNLINQKLFANFTLGDEVKLTLHFPFLNKKNYFL